MKLRLVYLGSRILQLRGRSGGVVSGEVGQGEIAHAKFIKKISNSVESLLAGMFSLFAQTMHPSITGNPASLPCLKALRISAGSFARMILSSELIT